MAEYEPKQRVCITGVGMDNLIHRHGTVTRLTATQIIVTDDRGTERRYRRDNRNNCIPYVSYGGTDINPTCKRPRPKG